VRVLNCKSINESYAKLINILITEGTPVSPRGIATREVSPLTVVIDDPRQNVIASPTRKLNYGFMNAELFWILTGSDSVDDIAWYNSTWANFSDDGRTLNGAYGMRIRRHPCAHGEVDQLKAAEEQLRADPLSRQATIVLFNPELDYKQTKDKPCTNLMRFKIRDDKLYMLVVMRSNDVMLGYPYDVYNFTCMQALLASKLGVGLGTYTHVVDSMHVYERDLGWAQDIVNEEFVDLYAKPWPSFMTAADQVDDVVQQVVNVAATTRNLGAEYSVRKVLGMVDAIEHEYWRSSAAMLALYNLRKHRLPQAVLDEVKTRITSEFSAFLDKYNELPPKTE